MLMMTSVSPVSVFTQLCGWGFCLLIVGLSISTAVSATRRHYAGTDAPLWKRVGTAASCILMVLVFAGCIALLTLLDASAGPSSA